MFVNNTKIIDTANTRKILKKLFIFWTSLHTLIKKYNNFDNTLKLFTHRYVKQKVNDNITLYPDDNEHCNDNNDISFNKNSIVYTSIQIPNNNKNETLEIDHHINWLHAPIKQGRRLLEENKSN